MNLDHHNRGSPRMSFPPLARIRQTVPQPRLDDVPGTVRRLILESKIRDRVKPGGTIAVGVGSRGITVIPTIARAAVDTLKEMGFRPFIVAAMGSHGGATSEGQRQLLAEYKITPETMGVEVRTDMDTVVVGTSPIGLPIYFDKNAHGADGIVLLNRVKPHTDFHAAHESGVLKMMVIGLGKRDGAEQIHKLGLRGMKEVLPAVGRHLIANMKFALGLAILENADDVPAEIVPLEPDTIFDVEPRLLKRARELMARLPFDQIDVLVIGELGKNYSGAGIDPNVTGRLMIETQNDFERPVVTRMVVLDVSEESHGNIVGVGFADLTTERLVSKLDERSFRINVLTSCCLERARIPITLPTDRDVFEAALQTCWRIDPSEARMVVIPNTLELSTLWVSPPLEEELRAHPHLTRETEYLPIPFSTDGTLDQESLFPESVRGRRAAGDAYAAH
ncbi:hypothetical protein Sinac_0817 [Singulisphaera acidiphila DSM 18658]|uniref:LarA-like N-terminal domain-containing protein n=2 Tax=Singulisphaera acidiphila TaxID=466153 RepID=L0D8N3_SINAD|nr:hypothetical protein Sinac_0817 [Singulisphaera acidiphila DSM 18658]